MSPSNHKRHFSADRKAEAEKQAADVTVEIPDSGAEEPDAGVTKPESAAAPADESVFIRGVAGAERAGTEIVRRMDMIEAAAKAGGSGAVSVRFEYSEGRLRRCVVGSVANGVAEAPSVFDVEKAGA